MSRQTSIASQFGAVAMTYFTHYWVMAGIAAWALLVLTPQLALGLTRNLGASNLGPSAMLVFGMPVFFLSLMIPPQAKAQFAHPRAALMPGFSRPHLMVLAGIAVVLTILFPLAAAFCLQLSPVGTVALAMAIAAPTLLAAHTNRIMGMFVGLCAFYSTMTRWGVWWFEPTGIYWPIHSGIIVVGGALVAFYLYRLAHLREEMDDYQSFTQWQQSRKASTEVSEQRRAVAESLRRHQFMAWFTDRWLDRIGGYHGNRLFALARLLTYGFGQPAILGGVWMAIWFGAITLFLAKFGFSSQTPGGPAAPNGSLFGSSMFFLQMAMLFPGMFPGEWLAKRRPRIAGELMLPLSRSQYIDGLLASTLWNAATFWFALNLGLVIITYATVGDRFSPVMLCIALLLTASGAFGLAGVSLRTAIWPSVIKRLGVMMLVMIPVQVPILLWLGKQNHITNTVILLSVVATTVVGVVMTRVARTAWLNLELG